MAIQNITYDNKSYINLNGDIPNTNKVCDTDMNEIKSVVNNNATELSNMIASGVGYIKYNDGTLICYGNSTITPSETRNAGGLTYYSGSMLITLPETFVDTNYIVTTNVYLANMNRFCNSYAVQTSESTLTLYLTNTTQNEGRAVNYIAIGKWK